MGGGRRREGACHGERRSGSTNVSFVLRGGGSITEHYENKRWQSTFALGGKTRIERKSMFWLGKILRTQTETKIYSWER